MTVEWRYVSEDSTSETPARRITMLITSAHYKLLDAEVHAPTLD